ncbi:MAG: ATP-binding cassette domain-containing protein [Pseudomonadota bacterium]
MLRFDLAYQRGPFRLSAKAEIGAGVTALCGPSGAGKSTLLALLAGLLVPQGGSLHFGDTALIDTRRRQFVPSWQRQFGLVFQDGQLFPHLSVRDNLLYGWQRRSQAERRYTLAEVLSLLEIGALSERRPAQLSGGERQRVALGRALLFSPRLLLLDEPLSSLDERLKQQILPFLKRIKLETRIPMIYVSHLRTEVDYLADRVLTIDAGQLAEGTKPSLQESRSTP